MKKALIALFAVLLSHPSIARVDDLQLIGEGQMKWLMFDVYHAALYGAQPEFEAGHYPLALALTYQRDISSSDLINVTRDEWRRLDIPKADQWIDSLASLWPDIKAGDKLAFRANSKDSGSFYFNDQHIGDIEGENFSECFLAIWLSLDAKVKKLRDQLIGNKHA
jgi:hypothetical protein